jgi:hypothetical protein
MKGLLLDISLSSRTGFSTTAKNHVTFTKKGRLCGRYGPLSHPGALITRNLCDPVTRRLRRVPATLGVALAVALTTSCSGHQGDPTVSRALYAIGNSHALRFSSDTGKTITEGLYLIANRGPGPVRIDRAE